MKLLFAIVQNDDVKSLIHALVEREVAVTSISSSGGFLSGGNATLMIGVDEARLQETLDIIQNYSERRKTMVAAPAFMMGQSLDNVQPPVQVTVGGATVFVVNVEQFHKF